MSRAQILGVGHDVPSKVVTNHDWVAMMPTSDEWIVQRSGIQERRFADGRLQDATVLVAASGSGLTWSGAVVQCPGQEATS